MKSFHQLMESQGTALVVQWLKLQLPMQGFHIGLLVRKLRSHRPCDQKKTKYKTETILQQIQKRF